MKAGPTPTTMASPSGEMWGALIAVAVLSMLMVVAMVKFSKAVVDPSIPAEVRRSRRRGWGLAYAALWIGIIGAFVVLLRHERGPHARKNWLLLAGMAGGWWALHGLILWFAGALARAPARDRIVSDTAAETPATDAEAHEEEPFKESREAIEETEDDDEEVIAPESQPARPSTARDTLRLIRNVVIVLLIVAAAQAIGP